jgi:excisionase family DNA binding protein
VDQNGKTIMATVPDLSNKPYLNVPEAAAILGVNVRTMYNAVDRGECPSIRVGRVIKIPTARFLAHYKYEPAPAAWSLAGPGTALKPALVGGGSCQAMAQGVFGPPVVCGPV